MSNNEKQLEAALQGHTPGPWCLASHGEANHHVINPERGKGSWIAVLQQNGERHAPEQEATARLIAAAPEMLEELKVATELCQALCTVAMNPTLERHLPYGLLEQVKTWLRDSRGHAIIAKATTA